MSEPRTAPNDCLGLHPMIASDSLPRTDHSLIGSDPEPIIASSKQPRTDHPTPLTRFGHVSPPYWLHTSYLPPWTDNRHLHSNHVRLPRGRLSLDSRHYVSEGGTQMPRHC
ncbi:hypothetical protein Tco_1259359 [Tanacetum coccineum]